MKLLYNSRDICTLAAYCSTLSMFGTHFKLNLWNRRTSCGFLLTTPSVTANCRARWRVELKGSSFSSRVICTEMSIKGLLGQTSSYRSVLCHLNSRTQYFIVPSEYAFLSTRWIVCGELSSLLCHVCNRERSRLASRFTFRKQRQNANVWCLSEEIIGVPLSMKNDRTQSKDSSLDNPSCD
jgi:hypothetical protein